jgi:methanogenic corrinoid protein MtbC1
MLSALLTTTMSIMKNVIQELDAQKLRKDVKIFVGGAPITEAFAKEIGADYYFEDAFDVRDYFKDNYEKLFPCKDQASGG